MNYEIKNNDIILEQPDFDLDETLDCGQAFRWEKIPSSHGCTYSGYFLEKPLKIPHIIESAFQTDFCYRCITCL